MTVQNREIHLRQYNEAIRKQRQSKINARPQTRITEEGYDWSLKPRTITDVAKDLGLCIGQRFATRQKLQLRICEVCQNLHKISRWTSRADDGAANRACVNSS